MFRKTLPLVLLLTISASAGAATQLQKVISDLLGTTSSNPVACFYAGLGDKERAIDLLAQAVSLGWGERAWMENASDFEPLRDEPRFRVVLARIH